MVWKSFEKFTTKEGLIRSRCIYCGTSYAPHTVGNGPTGMRRHIPKCTKDPKNLQNQKIMFQKKANDGDTASGTLQTWRFDQQKVRNALTKMIIVDELPFSFVEKEGFQEFVETCCPSFHIPSRYTISRDCAQMYLEEKIKLKNFFIKRKQRVCLTTDTWTLNENVNYMCLTSHIIDDNWTLHKRIINFTPIFSHKGEEIGRAVERCLIEWEIDNVMTITVDNASSNDVAIAYLSRRLENNVLGGKYLHMMCFAHIINLVVKDGLKEHDVSITRVRTAVKFVRHSPSRLQKFKDCVKECDIDIKHLISLDCPTRWNSTYTMLETAQKFEKAFKLYEIKDPIYKHDLEDSCGVPERSDWDIVRKFANFLEIFYTLTVNISGSSYITSNLFFHEILDVDVHLRESVKSLDDTRGMALKMKEKFDKYWGKIEKMNMLLYVAVVLDPRYKMEYLEFGFENLYKNESDFTDLCENDDLCEKMIKLVRDTTFELFNEYKFKFGTPQQIPSNESYSSTQQSSKSTNQMYALFQKQKLGGRRRAESKTELDKYLNEDCDDDVHGFDILLWWKNNSARFPVLSIMAKDVLAIPISTVASESAFSTGGRVLDQFRSSLSPPIVEALLCTQDWIRKSKKQIKVEEDLANIDNLARELCDKLAIGDATLDTTIDTWVELVAILMTWSSKLEKNDDKIEI